MVDISMWLCIAGILGEVISILGFIGFSFLMMTASKSSRRRTAFSGIVVSIMFILISAALFSIGLVSGGFTLLSETVS